MTFGYLVVALVAVAVTIFAFQNSEMPTVKFLLWTRQDLPVWGLILASLGAGLVLAGVPLVIQKWRLHARVRTLETRVRMLESAVEERTRAVLGQPPPPRPPASDG